MKEKDKFLYTEKKKKICIYCFVFFELSVSFLFEFFEKWAMESVLKVCILPEIFCISLDVDFSHTSQ